MSVLVQQRCNRMFFVGYREYTEHGLLLYQNREQIWWEKERLPVGDFSCSFFVLSQVVLFQDAHVVYIFECCIYVLVCRLVLIRSVIDLFLYN